MTSPIIRLFVAASIAASLSACSGEGDGGSLMRPGEDCMSCHEHQSGENGWSAAGTVYASPSDASGASGVTVQITDANGKQVSLTSNSAGNFFTADSLALPFSSVSVTRNGNTTSMGSHPTSGSCNTCHASNGAAHAHVYAP